MSQPESLTRHSTAVQIRVCLFIAASLTLIKLWLTRSQPMFAISGAGHDDLLFVKTAWHILNGQWLGPYDELTLSKGAMYPLWIAALRWLHIPLHLGEHLAYAGACILATLACFPIVKNPWLRLSGYVLLQINPVGWSMIELGRVLRQNLHAPLSLAVLACGIALCVRPAALLSRRLAWSATGGLCFSAFWLTREESIWIVPSLILLSLVLLGNSWVNGKKHSLRDALLGMTLWGITTAIPILTVCTINKTYYGWFGTVEFRSSEFQDAYGALIRVIPEKEYKKVPVTRETLKQLYPLSPSLRQLEPYIEGGAAESWAKASEHCTGLPNEMGGGWFMWMLRQTVRESGNAGNAGQAMRFYRNLADEINAACDAGLVKAGPRRSGFMPRMHFDMSGDYIEACFKALRLVYTSENFNAHTYPSVGPLEQFKLFHEVTGERFSPHESTLPVPSTVLTRNDEARVEFLDRLGHGLKVPLLILNVSCVMLFVLRGIQLARLQQDALVWLLAASVMGAALAAMLINALIHATSFDCISIPYFAQVYPLIHFFTYLVIVDHVLHWRQLQDMVRGET